MEHNNIAIKILKYTILLIGLLLICPGNITGQKMHVYSKVIEKTIAFRDGDQLIINGDKAKILITSHSQKIIKIKLNLISKNANQELAKKELSYHVGNISQKEGKILIENVINLPRGIDNTYSDLHSIYEIQIPKEYINININNRFGIVKLSEINGNISIESEYTDIEMKNITGVLNVNNKLGDVFCEWCNTQGFFKLNYSNCNLVQLSGKNELDTKAGAISIQPDTKLAYLLVNSKNTKITVFNKNNNTINYDISANTGNIYVTEDQIIKNTKFIKADTRNSKTDAHKFIFNDINNKGSIKIISSFGDIYIQ